MRLLVTRPQEEAERTADELRKRGHEALIAPMLTIEPVAATFNAEAFNAVIMTSGNAARTLARDLLPKLRALPLLAVGRQTAQAGRDAGFSDVISANGDGGDLIALIRDRFAKPGVRLLYLAGSDRSRDLTAELAADRIVVETVIVYAARPATRLPDAAGQALESGSVGGVLHYSRRSAAAFLVCIDAAGLTRTMSPLVHYCLSERAAEPLLVRGFNGIRIASRPDEAALLDLIAAN